MSNSQFDMLPDSLPKEIATVDLAMLFGLTTQRITQLSAEGLPKIARGRFPLVDAVKWYINYWKTKKLGGGSEIDSLKGDLLKQQIRKAQTANDAESRLLIPAHEIQSTLNAIAVIISSRLDSIAPRLANELTNQDDPALVKSILENETRQIRIAISNEFNNLQSDSDSGADNKTAAD